MKSSSAASRWRTSHLPPDSAGSLRAPCPLARPWALLLASIHLERTNPSPLVNAGTARCSSRTWSRVSLALGGLQPAHPASFQTDVGESDAPIPLPNVSSNVLRKVIEWCEHHKKDPEPLPTDLDADDSRKRTTEISDWDQKFIQVDQEMLFEIILAANYLDIKPLLYVSLPSAAHLDLWSHDSMRRQGCRLQDCR